MFTLDNKRAGIVPAGYFNHRHIAKILITCFLQYYEENVHVIDSPRTIDLLVNFLRHSLLF